MSGHARIRRQSHEARNPDFSTRCLCTNHVRVHISVQPVPRGAARFAAKLAILGRDVAVGSVSRQATYHIAHMANYLIEVNPNGHGYLVQVISGSGARNTMLGFITRSEAEAWIATDQARGHINQGADQANPDALAG